MDTIDSINDEIENIKKNGNSDPIPDYYYSDNYLPNKIDEIKQYSSFMHGVSFVFITDLHFLHNQNQSKKLIKKILNETNVPFVICGGDLVYLYGTQEQLDEQIAEFNDFKSTIGKHKVFSTRGNHELYNLQSTTDKTEHTYTSGTVYDLLMRENESKVTNMSINNMCYCIDNEKQRTRIIVLNTSDLSPSSLETGGGILFRGSTLQWFVDALNEKDNYKIIVVTHHPLNDNILSIEVDEEGNRKLLPYDFGNGENNDKTALLRALQFCKNKSLEPFTAEILLKGSTAPTKVTADFSKNTNEIVCVISGHRHMDTSSIQNNILNTITTCDCIDVKDGYGRKPSTINEQAFDVVCVNYDTQKLNLIRVGAGSNREFDIPDVTLLKKTSEDKFYTADEIDAKFENNNSKSAYEIACDNGFEGTETEWLTSLKGTNGTNGTNGIGIVDADINDNGNLILFYSDGTQQNLGVVVGADGQNYILTDNDKINIANQVLSLLPNGDEVSY